VNLANNPLKGVEPMTMAKYIKEVGRGAAGARSLSRADAKDALVQVLDRQASDFEIGAFVMALRMKGEALPELCGFLDAIQQRCEVVSSDRPVVVIPSYNGSRRLPNLTPLLALELARAGARVLLHSPAPTVNDTSERVPSELILQHLGLANAQGGADVHAAWARREPAFVSLGLLCQPLQDLLELRWRLGVRNVGHTLAKMILPVCGARCLRLVNYTHPEFGALMAQWAQEEQADAMVLRGTEGEAVTDPRRQGRIDTYLAGQHSAALSALPHEGVLTELPLLPRANDAATTAVYIQDVLAGERPAPATLTRQVNAVLAALALLQSPATPQDLRV